MKDQGTSQEIIPREKRGRQVFISSQSLVSKGKREDFLIQPVGQGGIIMYTIFFGLSPALSGPRKGRGVASHKNRKSCFHCNFARYRDTDCLALVDF